MEVPSDAAQKLKQRAILCVLGSSASFVVAAALVKAVAADIPTFQIMLCRSLFALLVMAPLLRRGGGWAALRTRQPWGHALRVAAGFAGMFGSFYGYAHLPMAMVTALGFAMPIFLTILSVPLLGERITLARAVSVGAGLLGVLVVVRPWNAEGAVELVPALVVVVSVGAWALAMVSIRLMGQAGERNITIVLWFSIACTVISGLLSIPVWVWPSPLQWLALIGVGVVSGVAQLLMTEGYRNGEATMLAPFEYGAIVYTVLIAWAIWGEVPGLWETVGILFLVIAGLFTWLREQGLRAKAGRPRPIPTPPSRALPLRPTSGAPPPSRPTPARRPG